MRFDPVRFLVLACALFIVTGVAGAADATGTVRTYYIAAD